MHGRAIRIPLLRNGPLDGKDMTDFEQFTVVSRLEPPTIRAQQFKPVETVCL